MAIVKAQKIPQKQISSTDIVARFCYFFPQYTYLEAKKLPYKRIVQLLKVARQEQAREWYNLTRITATANSSKKGAVNDLLSEFKNIIEE